MKVAPEPGKPWDVWTEEYLRDMGQVVHDEMAGSIPLQVWAA